MVKTECFYFICLTVFIVYEPALNHGIFKQVAIFGQVGKLVQRCQILAW
jgi:hypothetical protein